MLSSRIALLGISLAIAATRLTAITVNQFNVTISEDFDTLANSSTSSIVPAGWELYETGSGANTTYSAGTGSSSTGNTYSFGATSATDRAFGSVRTSSVISTIGTVVTNTTGGIIKQLTINYTGEQWRLGATGRQDRLDFGYSLDATSLATGSWLDVDSLDFVAPTTAGATGALDGNAAENRVFVSFAITGLNLASGASLWLRWTDFEASGSDDGLGIDDFSISATKFEVPIVPEAASVPENLPLGVVAATFGSLVLFGATRQRRLILNADAATAQVRI